MSRKPFLEQVTALVTPELHKHTDPSHPCRACLWPLLLDKLLNDAIKLRRRGLEVDASEIAYQGLHGAGGTGNPGPDSPFYQRVVTLIRTHLQEVMQWH